MTFEHILLTSPFSRSEAPLESRTAVNPPRPSSSWRRSVETSNKLSDVGNRKAFSTHWPTHGSLCRLSSPYDVSCSGEEESHNNAQKFLYGGVEISERLPTRDEILEQEPLVIVGFEGSEDRLNPHNCSLLRRSIVSCCIGANTFLVSAFASAYLFVAPHIETEFDVSREYVIAGFVVYVAMWGFGPLVWAPLSSNIGRKPVYIFSSAAWTLCNIGCVRAPGIKTLIACRFLSGLLGSGCLCNGSGSNADMFVGHARTRAIALYIGMVYLGPVIGPIFGGAVSTYAPTVPNAGWRWIFYGAIIGGVVVTIGHCLIMETNHNIRLRTRVRTLRNEQERQITKKEKSLGESRIGRRGPIPVHFTTEEDCFGASLSTIMRGVVVGAARMLFEEPIILFISLWQTTVSAVVYLFFEGFNIVFAEGHGFTPFQTGLCFIGVGVGMLSACAWACTGDLKLWDLRVVKHNGDPTPEMRVPQGLAGAVMTVVGLFWFGYTSYPFVHWIVPIFGAAVYGAGAISVVMASMAYVVDTYNMRAAPAFAAVGLIRSIVTSVLPLVGTQFFQNLNPRNACLILGILACLQIATPLAAIKYGEWLRHRSKFGSKFGIKSVYSV